MADRTAASASARLSVTVTPLPAANPSAFTTHGPPDPRMWAPAASGSSNDHDRAVGTPWRAITALANAFEPSRRAPEAVGPKARIPLALSASTAPATRGSSGPTTTRSTTSASAMSAIADGLVSATSTSSATSPIPGLPGAA